MQTRGDMLTASMWTLLGLCGAIASATAAPRHTLAPADVQQLADSGHADSVWHRNETGSGVAHPPRAPSVAWERTARAPGLAFAPGIATHKPRRRQPLRLRREDPALVPLSMQPRLARQLLRTEGASDLAAATRASERPLSARAVMLHTNAVSSGVVVESDDSGLEGAAGALPRRSEIEVSPAAVVQSLQHEQDAEARQPASFTRPLGEKTVHTTTDAPVATQRPPTTEEMGAQAAVLKAMAAVLSTAAASNATKPGAASGLQSVLLEALLGLRPRQRDADEEEKKGSSVAKYIVLGAVIACCASCCSTLFSASSSRGERASVRAQRPSFLSDNEEWEPGEPAPSTPRAVAGQMKYSDRWKARSGAQSEGDKSTGSQRRNMMGRSATTKETRRPLEDNSAREENDASGGSSYRERRRSSRASSSRFARTRTMDAGSASSAAPPPSNSEDLSTQDKQASSYQRRRTDRMQATRTEPGSASASGSSSRFSGRRTGNAEAVDVDTQAASPRGGDIARGGDGDGISGSDEEEVEAVKSKTTYQDRLRKKKDAEGSTGGPGRQETSGEDRPNRR
eukprot:TRINITY_DN80259_c0_g1_i1.p1 TRINITY_DN80259_c0_g1~~TRINITY_DN80259_c0_g1_i1.p1  ORF type:complete len:569 (+),score=115.60 TRINITY_DN80259_c0_g1_i1:228-1934(+)